MVRAQSASAAPKSVLRYSGATRPKRDIVDERIVRQVRQRRGGLMRANPADVGGWPNLRSAPPSQDRDNDGMADE